MAQPFVISAKFALDGNQVPGAVSTIRHEIDAVGQSAEQARTSLDRMLAGANKPTAFQSQAFAAMMGVRDDFGSAARGADIAAYGRQLDDLRAKFVPLFSLERQHKANIEAIRTANRVGAISIREMTAAIETENKAHLQAVTALNANAEATQRLAASRRMAANDNGGSFATANVAAQFQDIAVTSAMGMSPIQIALQQGTQLSAVFGPMGAAGAVRTLGAAFLSLVNPVSLVTLGLVGGTAAAIQYFSSLSDGAQDIDARLAEHLEHIEAIARGYDDAIAAAKNYAEQGLREPEGSVVSNLQAQIAAAERDITAAFGRISAQERAIATDMRQWQLQRTLNADLIAAADGLDHLGISASSTTAEIAAVHTRLTMLVNDSSIPSQVRQYATDFLKFVDEVRAGRIEVGTLQETLNQMPSTVTVHLQIQMDNYNAARGELLDLMPDFRSSFDRDRDEAKARYERQRGAATDMVLRIQAAEDYKAVLAGIDRQEAEYNARASARAGEQVSAFDRQIQALRQRTAAQQLETHAVGLSTYASERARMALQLENAAREDAIGLTPQRIALIEQEASAYALAAAAQEQATEKQRQATQELDFYRSTFTSFFTDLRAAQEQGLQGWDAWAEAGANALDKIADRALSMAANGIFDMIFGAISSAFTGGISINPLSLGAGGPGFLGGGASVWPGYDTGGWTGGVRNKVAGYVHGEEFVVRAGPAAQNRQLLETINAGGSIGIGGGQMLVQVIDQRGSGTIAREQSVGPNGEKKLRLIIRDEVQSAHRRGAAGF